MKIFKPLLLLFGVLVLVTAPMTIYNHWGLRNGTDVLLFMSATINIMIWPKLLYMLWKNKSL